jgi:hypothetical protein
VGGSFARADVPGVIGLAVAAASEDQPGNDGDFTCEYAHVFFRKSFRIQSGAVTGGDVQPAITSVVPHL